MKTLLLFTASYPFGKKETYLHNEIRYLSSEFESIKIYPLYFNDKHKTPRTVPDNVTVMSPPIPYSNTSRIWCFFGALKNFRVLKISLLGFWREKVFLDKSKVVIWLKHTIDFLLISQSKQLEDALSYSNATLYFYWAAGWADVLSYIQKNGKNYYCVRVHGGDVDVGRSYFCRHIKEETLLKSDKILACSKHYKDYLEQTYSVSREKCQLSYLGTFYSGLSPSPIQKGVIRIVTASNLIPLKRVDLLIDALALISDHEIDWIHFGDGISFNHLVERSKATLSENITVNFMGAVANSVILEFYRSSPVDVFINLSLWEGLPVSIMEAMSFSIPVIATDTGGTKELVDGSTGLLLPINLDIQLLAQNILLVKGDVWVVKRDGAFKRWSDNFNAAVNYPTATKSLLGV